jgi:hypothetical protein
MYRKTRITRQHGIDRGSPVRTIVSYYQYSELEVRCFTDPLDLGW